MEESFQDTCQNLINKRIDDHVKRNAQLKQFSKDNLAKFNDSIKDFLLSSVLDSKDAKKYEFGFKCDEKSYKSSSAITLLNYFGIDFSGMNFESVCIPYADLSYSNLTNTNLNDSDCRNVWFTGCKLKGVNLNRAWLMNSSLFSEFQMMNIINLDDIQYLEVSPHYELLLGYGYFSLCTWSLKTNSQLNFLKFKRSTDDDYVSEDEGDYYDEDDYLDTISCAKFSYDSQEIALGIGKNLEIWTSDLKEHKRSYNNINVEDFEINCLTYYDKGKKIAFSNGFKGVLLWDLESDKTDIMETKYAHINQIQVYNSDKNLISGADDGSVVIWDLIKKIQIHKFKAHLHGILALSISEKDNIFITGGNDAQFIIWDLQNYKKLRQSDTDFEECIDFIQCLPKGEKFIVLDGSRNSSIYNIQNFEKPLYSTEDQPDIWGSSAVCHAIYNDRDVMIYGNKNSSTLIFYDIESKCVVNEIIGQKSISVFQNLPNDWFISCGCELEIRIWDFIKKSCVDKFPTIKDDIMNLVVDTKQNLMLANYIEKKLLAFNLQTRQVINEIHYSQFTNQIIFSPNGKYFALLSTTGVILVNTQTLKMKHLLRNHEIGDFIGNAVFSPNSTQIFSVSGGTNKFIWELKSLKRIKRINSIQQIKEIKYSHDGQYLIIEQEDSIILLEPKLFRKVTEIQLDESVRKLIFIDVIQQKYLIRVDENGCLVIENVFDHSILISLTLFQSNFDETYLENCIFDNFQDFRITYSGKNCVYKGNLTFLGEVLQQLEEDG